MAAEHDRDPERAREVVMLRMPEARKIGDALAVGIIRSKDEYLTDTFAAALDELIYAFAGGVPLGWRALT